MLERRAARGRPTPALDEMPELFEDLEQLWTCFWQLDATRRHGVGGEPLALTMTDVAAALEMADVERSERMEWCSLISLMDQARMSAMANRIRKEREKRGNAKGSDRRSRRDGRR
jgi:hypothetical protein